MAEKELRRMSREELVEIIYAMQQQQQQLEQENQQLTEKLQERTLKWEKAGSLADAALSLNGVFEAAQAAADQYLASIQAGQADAEARAKAITDEAQAKADQLLADARRDADALTAQAQKDADAQWETFRQKVRAAVQVSPELAELLQGRQPHETSE